MPFSPAFVAALNKGHANVASGEKQKFQGDKRIKKYIYIRGESPSSRDGAKGRRAILDNLFLQFGEVSSLLEARGRERWNEREHWTAPPIQVSEESGKIDS